MSELSDYRITDEDVAQNGVIAAPDRLTGTAAQNKAVFDRLIRDALKEKYNAMLTAVEAHLAWEPYDTEKAYVPGNKVVYNGSSYLCTAACTGVLPTNAAHWRLIAARGVDGKGVGDMRADIYDPRGIETDVFTYVDERTDIYSKPETLSEETAQLFVDACVTDAAPQTPDEAFATIIGKTNLITEIITETTKWKAPSGIKGAVHLRLFGAGGMGGFLGGGGGGGGYMQTLAFTPVPGESYEVIVGAANSAPTSFGGMITANGGEAGRYGPTADPSGDQYTSNGGKGGSGGGGGCAVSPSPATAGNGGSGSYGGGGGGGGISSGYAGNGGSGGPNGGGGGGGGPFTYTLSSGGRGIGGIGGSNGGNGGSVGNPGGKGTDTKGMPLDFVGEGLGGAASITKGGGGGGGGYGGNGGKGGYGGGGGGGYGGKGGDGGVYAYSGGGGGGGYGGNGGSGGSNTGRAAGGGGGGGYGKKGNGGNGGAFTGADGGIAAGGGGGGGNSSGGAYGGKGGPGIVIVTYQKYVLGG